MLFDLRGLSLQSSRLYCVRLLRVLLRAGSSNFHVWGADLLCKHLADDSNDVQQEALSVLIEAAENEVKTFSIIFLYFSPKFHCFLLCSSSDLPPVSGVAEAVVVATRFSRLSSLRASRFAPASLPTRPPQQHAARTTPTLEQSTTTTCCYNMLASHRFLLILSLHRS